MKYLILLLPLLSQSTFAADECASAWVYYPFKTCESAAHGLDLSQPGTNPATLVQKSDWLSGGKDQRQVCSNVAAAFNRDNLKNGLHAEAAQPTPVGEQSENRIIQQQYQYACELTVKTYPFKTAATPDCGVEDKVSYQVGGSSRDLTGANISCLSCDNLSDSKPAATVQCLRQNVEKIVEPKAIELRDSDLSAISARMAKLLKLSQQVPIENLATTDQLSFFVDFIEKHPPQKEPSSGGGGGFGTRPTLQ
jgi:hypothetical protein